MNGILASTNLLKLATKNDPAQNTFDAALNSAPSDADEQINFLKFLGTRNAPKNEIFGNMCFKPRTESHRMADADYSNDDDDIAFTEYFTRLRNDNGKFSSEPQFSYLYERAGFKPLMNAYYKPGMNVKDLLSSIRERMSSVVGELENPAISANRKSTILNSLHNIFGLWKSSSSEFKASFDSINLNAGIFEDKDLRTIYSLFGLNKTLLNRLDMLDGKPDEWARIDYKQD